MTSLSRRLRFMPLWLRSIRLSWEKCPSIRLVVLGIPISMLSYQVNSSGRFRLTLRYALRNFLFMTFDFVKVTKKSRFLVGSTIIFVHYVLLSLFANDNILILVWTFHDRFLKACKLSDFIICLFVACPKRIFKHIPTQCIHILKYNIRIYTVFF